MKRQLHWYHWIKLKHFSKSISCASDLRTFSFAASQKSQLMKPPILSPMYILCLRFAFDRFLPFILMWIVPKIYANSSEWQSNPHLIFNFGVNFSTLFLCLTSRRCVFRNMFTFPLNSIDNINRVYMRSSCFHSINWKPHHDDDFLSVCMRTCANDKFTLAWKTVCHWFLIKRHKSFFSIQLNTV